MIFDFPYHTFETEYPESGFRVALGNSYTHTAPPSAPDQRKFTLKFSTMIWIPGDVTSLPAYNMGRLNAFYNAHKLWAVFTYPHPMFGDLPCRFNKPLKIPKSLKDGGGHLESFEIELIEAPGMNVSF